MRRKNKETMTNQEILLKYLTDMHALEKHLAQPLQAQADDADFGEFPEARSLVQRLEMRTKNAAGALEILIEEMGGETRTNLKSVVTAAAGAVAAAVNEGRVHKITKKLRDDYTALSLVSIGYELLHATGNALGNEKVASLSLRHLRDVAGFIMDLSQVIIPVAVEELAKTNPDANVKVTVPTQLNIREAWRSPEGHHAAA
jgi:ferritin-like metal-binding protein YciE